MIDRGEINPIEKPHDFCLSVFQCLNELNDEQDLCNALEGLHGSLSNLRQAYINAPEEVEYEGETCSTYLLAYLPYYLVQSFQLFNKYLHQQEYTEELRVAFLTTGPAPEPVALIEYLNRHFPDLKVHFDCFDFNTSSWENVNSLVMLQGCVERYRNFTYENHYLDLLESGAFHSRANFFQKTDLVVMQNSLNEMIHDEEILLNNLKELFATLKENSVFLLSDLRNLSTRGRKVKGIIKRIELLGREFGNSIRDTDTYGPMAPNSQHILQNYLYSDSRSTYRVARSSVKVHELRITTTLTDPTGGYKPDFSNSGNITQQIPFREMRRRLLTHPMSSMNTLRGNVYPEIKTRSELMENVYSGRSVYVALWLTQLGSQELEREEKGIIKKEIEHAISLSKRTEIEIIHFSNSIQVNIKWPNTDFVNVGIIEISIRNDETSIEVQTERHVVERTRGNEFTFALSEYRTSSERVTIRIALGSQSKSTGKNYLANEKDEYEYELFLPRNPKPQPEPEPEPQPEPEPEPQPEPGLKLRFWGRVKGAWSSFRRRKI